MQGRTNNGGTKRETATQGEKKPTKKKYCLLFLLIFFPANLRGGGGEFSEKKNDGMSDVGVHFVSPPHILNSLLDITKFKI